jgi:hypothetical protein
MTTPTRSAVRKDRSPGHGCERMVAILPAGWRIWGFSATGAVWKSSAHPVILANSLDTTTLDLWCREDPMKTFDIKPCFAKARSRR